MFSLRRESRNLAPQVQLAEEFFAHLDRALDVFGPSVKSVVYFRFCQENKLEREDIAYKPELFVQTIEQFFGVGSNTVKSAIEKEMRAAVAPLDLGLADTVSVLKTACDHLTQYSRQKARLK